MKRMRKVVIVLILGIILSAITSYVVAETLIDSRNVSFVDTKELAADNVQDAIDGTCDKMNSKLTQVDNKLLEIDNRFEVVEDKLYTVKKMYGTKETTTATNLFYTGLSITFPANSYCAIRMGSGWASRKPTALRLVIDKEDPDRGIEAEAVISDIGSYLVYANYFENEETHYVWIKYNTTGLPDKVTYEGFCATKYKQ